MTNEALTGYVTKADERQIRVKVLDLALVAKLVSVGFVFDDDLSEYVLATNDESKKASIFEVLREIGLCFSGGREWCPSEIFEDFRDRGLLRGEFKKVSWSGPGEYRITMV